MPAITLGIASIICFGSAAFLAFSDKPGWGWLIFAGILAAGAAAHAKP